MIHKIMMTVFIALLTGCKDKPFSRSVSIPELSSKSKVKDVEQNNLRNISYSHGPHGNYIRFSIEITDNEECRLKINRQGAIYYVSIDSSVTDSMFARFENLKGISNFKEYSDAMNDTELEYHLAVYDGRYPRRGYVNYIIPVEKLPEFAQVGQWLKDLESIYNEANNSQQTIPDTPPAK